MRAAWRPIMAALVLGGAVAVVQPAVAAPPVAAQVCIPEAPATCIGTLSPLVNILLGIGMGSPSSGSYADAVANDDCGSLADPLDNICEAEVERRRQEAEVGGFVSELMDLWLDRAAGYLPGSSTLDFDRTADAVISTVGTAPDVDIWIPGGAGNLGQDLGLEGPLTPETDAKLLPDLQTPPPGRSIQRVMGVLAFQPDPSLTSGVETTLFFYRAPSSCICSHTLTYEWTNVGGSSELRDIRVRWRGQQYSTDSNIQLGSVQTLDHPATEPVYVVWGSSNNGNSGGLAVGGGTHVEFGGSSGVIRGAWSTGVNTQPVVSNGTQRVWLWWGSNPSAMSWDDAHGDLANELAGQEVVPWDEIVPGDAEVPVGPVPDEVTVTTVTEAPTATVPTTAAPPTSVAPTATVAPAPEETPEMEAARELGNRQAGFFDGLANRIGSAFGWLGSVIESLFSGLMALLQQLFGWLGDLLTFLFNTLFELLRDLFGIVTGYLRLIWEALGHWLPRLAEILVTIPQLIVQGINAAIELVILALQAVVTAVEAVISAVLSLPGLIIDGFLDGLAFLFIPDDLDVELDECRTSLPCSWLQESIEVVGAVFTGLEGGVDGSCVAPAIGWTEFRVSFPPPPGCAAGSGTVALGEGASDAGDLFGYRAAIRLVLAISLFAAVALHVIGWAPWQRKQDEPQQLVLNDVGRHVG